MRPSHHVQEENSTTDSVRGTMTKKNSDQGNPPQGGYVYCPLSNTFCCLLVAARLVPPPSETVVGREPDCQQARDDDMIQNVLSSGLDVQRIVRRREQRHGPLSSHQRQPRRQTLPCAPKSVSTPPRRFFLSRYIHLQVLSSCSRSLPLVIVTARFKVTGVWRRHLPATQVCNHHVRMPKVRHAPVRICPINRPGILVAASRRIESLKRRLSRRQSRTINKLRNSNTMPIRLFSIV